MPTDFKRLSDVAPVHLFQIASPACKLAQSVDLSVALPRVCRNPEANPLAIREVLDATTAHEWRDWDPAAIRDFVGIKESDVLLTDKILAVQVAVTNQDVFNDWDLFLHVCTAFNHRRANFEWVDQPSTMEAAWACTCLRSLEGGHQFGPGILRFIGAVCLVDGLVYFPWTGGSGLHLCEGDTGRWARGLVDPDLCAVGSKVRELWESGKLQELDPSDVDETDQLQAQLGKIVAAQAYIRSQLPRDPGEYEDLP